MEVPSGQSMTGSGHPSSPGIAPFQDGGKDPRGSWDWNVTSIVDSRGARRTAPQARSRYGCTVRVTRAGTSSPAGAEDEKVAHVKIRPGGPDREWDLGTGVTFGPSTAAPTNSMRD